MQVHHHDHTCMQQAQHGLYFITDFEYLSRKEKLKYGVAEHKDLAFLKKLVYVRQHCSKCVCICVQIHNTDM